jgi:N-acetylmuramic acid 6-phosphate etherase
MADDLFDPRLTEHSNPRTRDIDLADAVQIVDLINAEDAGVPGAVQAERERIAEAIEIAVECFKRGGRLVYVGAGTSGRLGVLDATECPPTFGTDPEMVQGIRVPRIVRRTG